jgi:transcriptional regulator of nitric oxide reductase
MRREARKRELQAPEFADVAVRWSLIGDAATATRFLNPGVRAVLAHSPKQETWCIGAGFVCCMYKGIFDRPQLEQFLAHSRRVLAAATR